MPCRFSNLGFEKYIGFFGSLLLNINNSTDSPQNLQWVPIATHWNQFALFRCKINKKENHWYKNHGKLFKKQANYKWKAKDQIKFICFENSKVFFQKYLQKSCNSNSYFYIDLVCVWFVLAQITSTSQNLSLRVVWASSKPPDFAQQ